MKPSEMFDTLVEAITQKFQIIITGPPGCGKTDIIKSVAKYLDMPILIAHPAICDPTDFKGMPFIDHNGNASFVPFADLRRLIETTRELIYFMDDAGQALPGTQAALMQLVMGGQVNDHHISDKVVFIMATNRREDMAAVTSIIEPLKSRFMTIVELEPDLKDWIDWAYKHDIAEAIIQFMQRRPHYLTAFKPTADMTNSPCARTIAFASGWVKSNLPRHLLPEVIAGCTGSAFSDEFISVMEMRGRMPSLMSIIDDPDIAPIPEDPDIMFAVEVGLVYLSDVTNLSAILKYVARIPDEYKMAFMVDLKSRHLDLLNTAEYNNFAIAHQHLFA